MVSSFGIPDLVPLLASGGDDSDAYERNVVSWTAGCWLSIVSVGTSGVRARIRRVREKYIVCDGQVRISCDGSYKMVEWLCQLKRLTS